MRLSDAAAKDGVFSSLNSKTLKVLQWHGDTFDLPAGAAHLASSPIVPHQAYAVDGRYYGLQFHVEVDRPMLEEWFKDRKDLKQILSEYESYKAELSQITEQLYGRFFACADTTTTRR